MLKKYFFGWSVPRIEYEVLPAQVPEPDQIAASNAVTLLHPKSNQQNLPPLYRVGDMVNTGQKISLFADDPGYVIATATGRITSISPFTGHYGKSYLAITIKIAEDEVVARGALVVAVAHRVDLVRLVGFRCFGHGYRTLVT